MSNGTIVQCIGAVVDIQFPRDHMPKIYEALTLVDEDASSFAEKGLTLEVQQQLGDGVVRTIALGSSDGLRRGMQVAGTGAPISVPVGTGTLGRIMDVLGRPIDDAGPIVADEKRLRQRRQAHRRVATHLQQGPPGCDYERAFGNRRRRGSGLR